MRIDYEFLDSFCKEILSTDNSIRWAGVINKNGIILAQNSRKEANLLLTDEENEEYASSAIARQKTRARFEPKIGKLLYAYGRYEKLHRATIPINEDYYLLISLNIEEKHFDSIIMGKIVPLIADRKNQFVSV